jgi:hypothetical protein
MRLTLNSILLKQKFLISILLISLTSCSYQAEKEYVTTCMAVAISNPLNLINGFIDSLQNSKDSKDSYKVNKYRDFCKCGFNETAKKFNFIEKFKLYYLDVGISDPLSSKYIEASEKSAEECKYILDETAKESYNKNQETESQKTIEADAITTSQNPNNKSIVSKYFKREILPPSNSSSPSSNNISNNYEKVKPNQEKVLSIFEYKTNNSCLYKERSFERRVNLKVNWDGKCQNGYISGIGTLVTEDKDDIVTVCEATYRDGWENGNGKCTYNYNNNGRIDTQTGTFNNGSIVSGLIEFEKGSQKITVEGSFKRLENMDVSGRGKIYYDNAEYSGEFYNWLPEGTGYMLYHSGQIESGKFSKGKLIQRTIVNGFKSTN